METHVDLSAIQGLFEKAHQEGRDFLYEFEVYELITHVGSESPPRWLFLPGEERLQPEMLEAIPGEKVVVKVVSPNILHKSDVDGVRIVEKENQSVLSTIRRMKAEIPEAFASLIESGKTHAPEAYRGLDGDALTQAISNDIKGVILVQFMPPDSQEFGNELLVSLRWTREFGMIINAGLGGTDTELYASRFRKGQAVVAASTAMVDGKHFFNSFKQTISYKKLAGLTRGQKRIVTNDQLLECFSALINTGNTFSPLNAEARFHIDELEINPFAFRNYLMLPLDGLCRFSPARKQPVPRPIDKIDYLLHPKTIGLAGVSAKGANVGRIIMDNILANGFDPANLKIIHPDTDRIGNIETTPSLNTLPGKTDLLILAVGANQIPELIDNILDNDLAESVLLIPGGMGEKEGQEHVTVDLKQKIEAVRKEKGTSTVFLGGNSLGILSHPGKYDAMFIPDNKLPKKRGDYTRHIALISQSGAYMITRMSKLAFLDPAYALSIGNQLDLTASDILRYMNQREDITTICFYMEGFNDQDGLTFAEAVREAIPLGKEIIFYKAGRTPEGKSATSGHTASIAGDYMVCESCISQAGAMVAENFTIFEGLLRLSNACHSKKISGNRLAAISNAGYESVGIADNILGEDYQLEMATFDTKTRDNLTDVMARNRLDSLIDVKNPLDITPMATEEVYEASIKALLDDENVDAVIAAVVPLTPILHTLEGEDSEAFSTEQKLVKRIPRLAAESDKPLVIVVDSGPLYDPLANALEDEGLPVFRSADRAVTVLGKYIHGRLKAAEIKVG